MKLIIMWIGFSHFGLSRSNILQCEPTIETEVYVALVNISSSEFCFDLQKSFRCTIYRPTVVKLNRQVTKCCPGYELHTIGSVSKCVCKNCPYDAKCDPISGSCYCKSQWHRGQCVDLCPEGYFGSDCDKQCEKFDNMIACDEVTGKPICYPKFIGVRCDIPCPEGFHCMDGKICRGDNCICPRGWKGSFCDEKCMRKETDCWLNYETKLDRLERCCVHDTCKCSENAFCSQTTGRCECAEGWRGSLCNIRSDGLSLSDNVSENRSDKFGWFKYSTETYICLVGVFILLVLCIFFLHALNRKRKQFTYKRMEFPSDLYLTAESKNEKKYKNLQR